MHVMVRKRISGALVAYYRVSTAKQGLDGYGIAAQRTAVEAYARSAGGCLLASYTEQESGTRNDRPQLQAALVHARQAGAQLVIAKLDRLSRNAAFLLNLRDAGVDFVACDLPGASRLTVGLMAVIAEHERDMISERTKAGMAEAKRRGARIGNPQGIAALIPHRARGVATSAQLNKLRAQHRANELQPVVQALRAQGVNSLSGIARALNSQGRLTAKGNHWQATSVRRVLRLLRLEFPSLSIESGFE